MKRIFYLSFFALWTLSTQAQQKIGNNPTVINPNAVLDLESNNKGLLLPRVALTSTNNVSPLSAHVAGMVVYNTANINDVTTGYYYNDGSRWIRLGGTNTSLLSGNTNPISTVGINGDFYINTVTNTIFGPKASGSWPASGTSIIGPQGPAGPQGLTGPQGPQGIQGIAGTNGRTVLNGTVNPVSTTGVDGDFYINTATNTIFGPKASGAWPANGTSLVGPQGSSANNIYNSNGTLTSNRIVTLNNNSLTFLTTLNSPQMVIANSNPGNDSYTSLRLVRAAGQATGTAAWDLVSGANGNSTSFAIEDISAPRTANNSPFLIQSGTSGNILMLPDSGRVGIGTRTPSTKLQVNGEISSRPSLPGQSSTGYSALILKNFTQGNNVFKIQSEFGNNDNIHFVTDGGVNNVAVENVRMSINRSNGNVGIGTLNPEGSLHISSSIAGTGYGFTNTAFNNIIFGSTGSYGGAQINFKGFQGAQLGAISVYEEAQDLNALRIDVGSNGRVIIPNGNLGIGVNVPTQKLHVNGGALISSLAGTGSRMVVADANGVLSAQTLPSSTNLYNSDGALTGTRTVTMGSNSLIFNTTLNSPQMIFSNSNSVDSSYTALRLVKAAGRTGETAWDLVSGINGDTRNFGIEDISSNRSGLNAPLQIQSGTSGGILLVPTTGGNVGIGTSTPQSKLDVRGSTFLGLMPAVNSTGVLRLGRADLPERRFFDIVVTNTADTASRNSMAFRLHTGSSTNFGEQIETMILRGDGNVGIGTSSPQTRLQVNGEISSRPIGGQSNTGYSAFILKNLNPGNNIFKIQSEFGTNENIHFITDGGDNNVTAENVRMSINRSTGNVGIGNITPNYALDVNSGNNQFPARFSTSSNRAELRIENSNTTDGSATSGLRILNANTSASSPSIHFQLLAQNGNHSGHQFNSIPVANDVLFVNHRVGDFHFIVDGDPDWGNYALTVNASGIGIGTRTPSQKLHVVGGALISSLAGSGSRMVVADANGILSTQTLPTSTSIYTNDGTLTSNRGVSMGSNNLTFTGSGILAKYSGSASNASTFYIGRTTTDAEFGVAGNPLEGFPTAISGDAWYKTLGTSNLHIGTEGNSQLRLMTNNTLRMTINSSGNVGIGTSTPNTRLQVDGDVSTRPTSGQSSTGYSAFILKNRNQGNNVFKIQSEFGTNDNIHFVTDGGNNDVSVENVRMSISRSTGNVGIGTMNPEGSLHISNSIAGTAYGFSSTAFTNIVFGSTGSYGGAQLNFKGFQGAQLGSISVYEEALNVNAMRFDVGSNGRFIIPNGNVGIGTDNPGYKFTVNGNNISINRNTPSEARFHLYNGGVIAEWLMGQKSATNHDLTFTRRDASGDVDYLVIRRDNGNVGIGTTNPNEKFTISGANNAVAMSIGNVFGNARIAVAAVATDYGLPNSGDFMLQNNSNKGMAFGTNGDLIRMYISNTGNVGIGTTNPTSRLQVVGLPVFANNAAALAGGLTVGAFYHNGDGIVRVVF